jgi:hypothetical protein
MPHSRQLLEKARSMSKGYRWESAAAMFFGHAAPVQRPSGEEVVVASALVGTHAKRGLARPTYAPQGEAFQFHLMPAFWLLAVAIAVLVAVRACRTAMRQKPRTAELLSPDRLSRCGTVF